MKFTDEQLSRILTAHDSGNLIRGGKQYRQGYPGCIAQIAFDAQAFNDSKLNERDEELPFWHEIFDSIIWNFDKNYDSSWSIEELIEYITSQELM